MTEVASQVWDGVADRWARHAESVDSQAAASTELMLDAAGVVPGGEVLDVGCGPGGAGLAAARRTTSTGRVVLADSAPAMIEVAARRSAGFPWAQTMVADLGTVPAPDASFDAVVCRYALMFADDPAAAVGEAVRVLRPGGGYAALVFGGPEHNGWQAFVLDALGDVLGVQGPPPGAPGPFSLADPVQLADTLRRGGLTDVQVQEVAASVIYPSLDDWWEEAADLSGPVPLVLAGLEPEARDAVRQRAIHLAEAVAHVDRQQGVRFEGQDLLARGRRPDRGHERYPADA